MKPQTILICLLLLVLCLPAFGRGGGGGGGHSSGGGGHSESVGGHESEGYNGGGGIHEEESPSIGRPIFIPHGMNPNRVCKEGVAHIDNGASQDAVTCNQENNSKDYGGWLGLLLILILVMVVISVMIVSAL